MSKILVLSLTLIAAFSVSCEKYGQDSNLDSDNPSYIFFDPKIKATVVSRVIETETFPKDAHIGVIGKYSNNQIFTSYPNNIADVYESSSAGVFVYDKLAQWQGADAHDFYSFYPYSLNSSVSINSQDGMPYISYEQPTTVNGMVDILTATKTTKKCNTVDFVFEHRLWWLNVKIDSKIEKVKVKSVKLTLKNFYSSGTLKFDGTTDCNNEITNGISYTLHDGPEIEISSGKSYNLKPMLFLPISVKEKLQFKLEIVFSNSDYVYTYPEQGLNGEEKFAKANIVFNPGEKYTLSVEKKYAELYVNLEKIDWSTLDVNHEFN